MRLLSPPEMFLLLPAPCSVSGSVKFEETKPQKSPYWETFAFVEAVSLTSWAVLL